MQLYLQADYAKARAPRDEPRVRHVAELRDSGPPPRPVRARAARALAAVALRLDGESATRRLLA
ncbi:MAG TPA: hypothetical protein VFT50_11150 [Baekduia sp.]|nr:hypothetical protein [Baekduia sp.]